MNRDCEVKRALISVSDKTGAVEFARGLAALGVEIISTGGTYRALTEAGVPALYVSEVTGFPEILGGRVKTLHPAIHGGILAKRSDPEHMNDLDGHGIKPIGLVAVNLYPFRETAARGGSWDELIENIDIGGPSMLRSAAKNHGDVIVLVHPEDYAGVLENLRLNGNCSVEERTRLAIEAFRHTAGYDACVYETLSGKVNPETRKKYIIESPSAQKIMDLRYGENPGQTAALFRDARADGKAGKTFIDAAQLQGKELSYNNWLDADGAFKTAQELGLEEPAAVIVKHTNPCGAALGKTIEEAFARAYASDPVSAFGGIAALNRPVTQALASAMSEIFWEVILAPGFSHEAREIFKAKPNLRLLELPEAAWPAEPEKEWRSIQGGFLVQDRDLQQSPPDTWETATKRGASAAELRDLVFAWKIVKHVKSNAIVLVKDCQTVGVGAGQMNRVGAAGIALSQAGEKARGAVLASDAFFPFADTVRLAGERGVSAIVQPGGSLRDKESTDAADEFKMAMLHTHVRHFRH